VGGRIRGGGKEKTQGGAKKNDPDRLVGGRGRKGADGSKKDRETKGGGRLQKKGKKG